MTSSSTRLVKWQMQSDVWSSELCFSETWEFFWGNCIFSFKYLSSGALLSLNTKLIFISYKKKQVFLQSVVKIVRLYMSPSSGKPFLPYCEKSTAAMKGLQSWNQLTWMFFFYPSGSRVFSNSTKTHNDFMVVTIALLNLLDITFTRYLFLPNQWVVSRLNCHKAR